MQLTMIMLHLYSRDYIDSQLHVKGIPWAMLAFADVLEDTKSATNQAITKVT